MLNLYNLLILLYLLSGVFYSQESDEQELSLVFMNESFGGVDSKDVQASLSVWTKLYSEEITRQFNLNLNTTFQFIEEVENLEDVLLQDRVDMLNVPTYLYKMLNLDVKYEPTWCGSRIDGKFEEYILIRRIEDNIEELKDLESKTIILTKETLYNISHVWLEVLLFENNFPKKESFFNNIIYVPTEGRAINSLYFKKAEAAIVTKYQFKLACELNPQLCEFIKPLIISEPLLLNISLLRRDYNPDIKKILLELTQNFHLNARNKQVLSLFRIENLDRINEEDLKSVNDLISKYREIPKDR